jgi:hypothetical protein
MAINNTVYEFMERLDRGDLMTRDGLEDYFRRYPEIFGVYFPDYCPKTDERLIRAIEQYPAKAEDISLAGQRLPEEIDNIRGLYLSLTGIDADVDHHLFAGAFGSSAFVAGEKKDEIFYALEMLSPEPDDLRLVAAHEMGHIIQYRMSAGTAGDDWWQDVHWNHPLVTLVSEGGAIYLSKLAVPGRGRPDYISFGALGEESYGFYMGNKRKLHEEFMNDMRESWETEKDKEWFRLSGGSRNGHSRLGYYIADGFMEHRAELRGMDAALTDWDTMTLEEEFMDYLKR